MSLTTLETRVAKLEETKVSGDRLERLLAHHTVTPKECGRIAYETYLELSPFPTHGRLSDLWHQLQVWAGRLALLGGIIYGVSRFF